MFDLTSTMDKYILDRLYYPIETLQDTWHGYLLHRTNTKEQLVEAVANRMALLSSVKST